MRKNLHSRKWLILLTAHQSTLHGVVENFKWQQIYIGVSRLQFLMLTNLHSVEMLTVLNGHKSTLDGVVDIFKRPTNLQWIEWLTV